MDGFSILQEGAWQPDALTQTREYQIGHAFGWLYRGNKQAATQHALAGRLYLAKSGWLLLSVPNALVRGLYDALVVPGAELPRAGVLNVPNVDGELLNAHISVMNADEVASIGADKINERGHMFGYTLGTLKEISVRNVDGVSKVWALQVSSPGLSALRKSYGLSPLPNGDHPFHITVAVRRTKVLQDNAVRKAAAELSRSGQKDLLPGGNADNVPDRDISPAALAEGTQHEHEHTHNDQVAKEIAKDHLSEDASYYEKIKAIEKQARQNPSVYMNQLRNMYSLRQPIRYDFNKPVFENIQNQMGEVKRRGDFLLQARRNNQQYRAALDPNYRYQLAMKAIRGEMEEPAFVDQMIENYGDQFAATATGAPR
jgi:hypothetical protein